MYFVYTVFDVFGKCRNEIRLTQWQVSFNSQALLSIFWNSDIMIRQVEDGFLS